MGDNIIALRICKAECFVPFDEWQTRLFTGILNVHLVLSAWLKDILYLGIPVLKK